MACGGNRTKGWGILRGDEPDTGVSNTMSLTLMIAASLSMPAAEYRDPSPRERAQVERVLRQAGFVRWDDIELDDGLWEVDDARTRDGGEYDLKIDPRSMRIVRRDGDRPANARERAAIERTLRQQGYTRWDSIKLDSDGYWEVDDARMRNGRDHDLKLDRRTLRIIARD